MESLHQLLSKKLEKKLRLMFKEIQIPFREVCPKNRKNFLIIFLYST